LILLPLIDHKKARIGTPNWMAPEILRGEKYDFPSDVYSFGMVMVELFSGQVPYSNKTPAQIEGIVSQPNYRVKIPEKTPKVFHDLLSKCLEQDPNLRPSFEEIFSFTQSAKSQLY
jgi:serine/threonine protein kinase